MAAPGGGRHGKSQRHWLAREDIFITRNGKTVAKVVNPQVSAVDSLRGMLGDVSSDVDMDSLREERLLKYENHV